MRDDNALAAGYVAAGVGPLAVASLLSPLRGQPLGTGVVVLALSAVIVAAAVLAGPPVGAVATLTAALWFDFLFIEPYRALALAPIEELWPAVALVAFGAATVGAVARQWRHPSNSVIPQQAPRPNASRHVQRVVLLIERGADARDVIGAVQAELTGLLLARSCRFESGHDATEMARIERDGTVASNGAEVVPPATELQLPVCLGGHRVGRFVIEPTPGAVVPLDHRIVAVILTDHLAAALIGGTNHAPPRS